MKERTLVKSFSWHVFYQLKWLLLSIIKFYESIRRLEPSPPWELTLSQEKFEVLHKQSSRHKALMCGVCGRLSWSHVYSLHILLSLRDSLTSPEVSRGVSYNLILQWALKTNPGHCLPTGDASHSTGHGSELQILPGTKQVQDVIYCCIVCL